jgi:hypothetical protein
MKFGGNEAGLLLLPSILVAALLARILAYFSFLVLALSPCEYGEDKKGGDDERRG